MLRQHGRHHHASRLVIVLVREVEGKLGGSSWGGAKPGVIPGPPFRGDGSWRVLRKMYDHGIVAHNR